MERQAQGGLGRECNRIATRKQTLHRIEPGAVRGSVVGDARLRIHHMDCATGQCRGGRILNCALDRSRSTLGECVDWREKCTGQNGGQGYKMFLCGFVNLNIVTNLY